MIKGIPVTLYEKTVIGKDEFDRPLHQEIPVTIENVLVAPASTTEILNALNLTGKKAVYNIAIPKGDNHTWQDCRVDFFGMSWQVIGFPQQGIEENIPLDWNQKWQGAVYGIVLNRAGVRELMQSPEMQAILVEHANKIASASETEAYVAQTRAVVKVCGDDGNNGLLKAVGKHGGKNR
jgi:hypothetical protein